MCMFIRGCYEHIIYVYFYTWDIPYYVTDCFVKNSAADVTPNGNRLYENLPKGVRNVVSLDDSSSSGI